MSIRGVSGRAIMKMSKEECSDCMLAGGSVMLEVTQCCILLLFQNGIEKYSYMEGEM